MDRRKVICLLSSLLLPVTGWCYGSYPSDKMIYAMAEGGIFQGTFNFKDVDQSDLIPQSYAGSLQQNGYTGGLGLGISKTFCKDYFLGLEFSGGGMGSNAIFQSGGTSSSFTDKFSMENYFDLTFVPGLYLTPSIAGYAKAGLTRGQFSDTINTPVGSDATFVTQNSTRHAYGFTGSLGVKKWLTSTLAILAEYNYRDYGTVSFPSFQNFTATYSHNARIAGQSMQLGLTYQFA